MPDTDAKNQWPNQIPSNRSDTVQQTLERAASTSQMRQTMAERVQRWPPNVSVVLTGEYYVLTQDEQQLKGLLENLRSAAGDRSGLLHFNYSTPVRSDGVSRVVQYNSYEEWSTAEAFLNYWTSSAVAEFHQAVEPLQASGQPTRLQLFQGRPETITPPDAPPPSRVPPLKTGQSDSWDAEGNLRRSGAGDDGDWEAGHGVPQATRFRDNNDGTVTDTATDLIWLKNANLFGEVVWPEALYLASQLGAGAPGLADSSRAGQWRLPNVNEMESILDLNKSFGASLPAESPFTNLEATNYWTSSSVARRTEDPPTPLGWFVALAVGPPVFDLKFNRMRMWPVRGRSTHIAQTGQKRCYDVFGNEVPCGQLRGQDGELQAGVNLYADVFFGADRNLHRCLVRTAGWILAPAAEARKRKDIAIAMRPRHRSPAKPCHCLHDERALLRVVGIDKRARLAAVVAQLERKRKFFAG